MYQGDPLLAAYRKFRPSHFDTDFFPNGEYTGDIIGCNWTCEGCWSRYGWRDAKVDDKLVLDPAQATTKLIQGMKRNGMNGARISGGEATYHWDHLLELLRDFMARTNGVLMDVGGEDLDLGICIDTNASMLTVPKLKRLNELADGPGDNYRLVLIMGIKATDPEGLAKLTGMGLAAATKTHKAQLRALKYALESLPHLGIIGTFLSSVADPEEFSRLQRKAERWAEGGGGCIEMLTYKAYGDVNQYYTPKRMRQKSVEGGDPQDPEVLMDLMLPDGSFPQEVDADDRVRESPAPFDPEEGGTEELRLFADAVAGLPEGEVRSW